MNLSKVLGATALFIVLVLSINADLVMADLKEDMSYIGDTVTYNQDTVIITDYYYWTNQYELSNGKKVHVKLYKK
jgi:hypothetical protein